MNNKERFFKNLKITRAVRRREKMKKVTPPNSPALVYIDANIKNLEDSLKEPTVINEAPKDTTDA